LSVPPVVTQMRPTFSSVHPAACAAKPACHQSSLQPSKPPRQRPAFPLPLSPSDPPWSPPMGDGHAGIGTATLAAPHSHSGGLGRRGEHSSVLSRLVDKSLANFFLPRARQPRRPVPSFGRTRDRSRRRRAVPLQATRACIHGVALSLGDRPRRPGRPIRGRRTPFSLATDPVHRAPASRL
jgi:hypothetical protein